MGVGVQIMDLVHQLHLETSPGCDTVQYALSVEDMQSHVCPVRGYELSQVEAAATIDGHVIGDDLRDPDDHRPEKATLLMGYITTSAVRPAPSGVEGAQHRFDVFLSHTWARDQHGRDNHRRVGLVNRFLRQAGLVTWFDDTHMSSGGDTCGPLLACLVFALLTLVVDSDIHNPSFPPHCHPVV